MSTWQEGDLKTNGISLHYYRTGGALPPLVMLHGVTDNGLCWTRVAKALEADYDVIMLDARGHGLSEVTEDGYGYEERAADAIGAIEALGLDTVVVWGHSMGAATAASAAVARPDLFAAVVLEDPPWRDVEETAEGWRERGAQRRKSILETRELSIEALVAEVSGQNPRWHEEELLPWAQSKKQVSPLIVSLALPSSGSWRELAPAIACPILLITAARGIVTPEGAAEAMQLLPQGQTVRFDAGHSVHRDAFEPVMAAARAFLAQVGW